jgi:hypothetical protein
MDSVGGSCQFSITRHQGKELETVVGSIHVDRKSGCVRVTLLPQPSHVKAPSDKLERVVRIMPEGGV